MRFFTILFALILVLAPLTAEDVDGLFEDPHPDTVADPNDKLTQDDLSKQSIRFFESVKAEGYYLAGWTDFSSPVKQSPYNALNFSFGTDARLDKNIRAYASFYITYPSLADSTTDNIYNPYDELLPNDPTLKFSAVEVKEMFLDYSLRDALFFRVGRESLTWGQGRIFNPANFVGSLSKGIGARATTTVLGLNLTAVAMKNDGYFNLTGDTLADVAGLETLGVASKLEGSWPLFSGGLSAFHHANVGDKGEAYLKTSFWGFDLFGEGLIERKLYNNRVDGDAIPTGLFGLYREFGSGPPWLQAQVELMVTGRGDSGGVKTIPREFVGWDDVSLGIGATSGLFNFLDTKPSLSWLHSFRDDSGQVLFGFTNTTLPHIDLTAGVVSIYGPSDGRYSSSSGNPDPLDRRLILTLKATFSFDIEN